MARVAQRAGWFPLTGELKVYVNGAFIPRHSAGGKVGGRTHWTVGNLLLTESALDLTTKTERLRIPLAMVTAVSALPVSMTPPPVAFEQTLYVYHMEANTQVGTAIAYPRMTVRNFPLQLAAALTGSIRAYMPRAGAAQGGYEEVRVRFMLDRFEVTRASGPSMIPLDRISNLSHSRLKDSSGRDYIEWVADVVDGHAVRPVTFLSYERLPFLAQLLGAVGGLRRNASLMQGQSAADSLSETAQQVAVMLYTGGMSAGSIEQMLGIKPDDLDAIYEQFLKLGLADVVKVRKEIQLNAAGAKLVDDIMKKQLQAAG